MELNILLNTIKNMVEPGTEVDVQLVQKGMTTLTGITIGTGTVRAVVYMEQFEEMFQESGYVAVASKMIQICQNENWKQTLNIEEITSWEYAKENIMLCIAPKDTIGNALTIPYLDLELYFRVNMEHGTYKLTEHHMEMWGVTEQKLIDLVMENSEYMTHTMLDIMLESLDLDDITMQMMKADPTLKQQIIVTNKERLFGASAIYKKEILKEIADQFRSDIYIIPSSIHELIVVPVSVTSAEEVTAQIQTVNATDVDPEDVLSDHVYIFSRETMEIEY